MNGFQVQVTTARGTPVSAGWHVDIPLHIGRDTTNDVVLHGWRVAPRHASIDAGEDGLHLRGVAALRVNGKAVQQYGPLRTDDVIEIHDYRIRVHCPSVPVPAPAPAEVMPDRLPDPPSPHTPAEDEADVREHHLWRVRLRRTLHEQMDLRRIDVSAMSDDALRALTARLIGETLHQGPPLPATLDTQALTEQVVAEAVGLGPLEPLLAEPEVSEIMVNNADEIFYERNGRLHRSTIRFTDDAAVQSIIQRIVSPLGRRIDEASPMVDARLADGSRVNAVIPPLALRGACLTIRKFMQERLTGEHLQGFGSISPAMTTFLDVAVRNRRNVLISGFSIPPRRATPARPKATTRAMKNVASSRSWKNEPRYFAVQVKPELMTADRPSASVRDQPTKRKMKPMVRARTRGSPIRRIPEVSAVGIAVSMEDIHTASLEIGRVML